MMKIPDELITQCMHCGLCLPVCPTYSLTGLEKSSPRGRIRLMKAVSEGDLKLSDAFAEEMEFCLDCQACETACPAGVKYGELVESARVVVDARRKFNLKKLILRSIVARRMPLRLAAGLGRFYQMSGLEKAATWILKYLQPALYRRAILLPRISGRSAFRSLPQVSEPDGKLRGTVAVLTGCVMDVFYSDVNRDTVEVLLRNGWRVVIPSSQVCCGSMSGHHGDVELPERFARKNIEAFEKSGAEYYVINSAGCGAFMKEYGKLLRHDRDFAERAASFSSKIVDFSEFLFKTGFKKPQQQIQKKTVYHEACHLVHTQKISSEPKSIVSDIAGENVCDLNEATWCCGSAGIYNVLRSDDASEFLERKMSNIAASGAEVVITGNPGCIAQISAGIRKHKMHVRVLHPATALNLLYKSEKI